MTPNTNSNADDTAAYSCPENMPSVINKLQIIAKKCSGGMKPVI